MDCHNNYTNKLLSAIIVMILPLFLSFHLVHGLSYSTLTMGCFIIAIVICNFSGGRILRGEFSKDFLVLFVLFIFFQFVAIVNGYLIDSFLLPNDIFNMFGKAIMIYTFVVIPLGQSISNNDFREFAERFTLLSFIICIFNVIDNISTIVNFFNISNSYQFTVTGVFANRNQFGAFMFIGIVAHTYLISMKATSKFDYIVYTLQFTNLILSMSRGAMLATGVFLLFYWGLHKHFITRHPLFSIFSFGTICIFGANSGIWGFIQRNIIRSEVGNSGRSDVWLLGLRIANRKFSSLFVGQGLFHGVSIAQSSGMSFDQFHSLYVDTIVSGGIIELLFLIALFSYIVIKVVRSSNGDLKWVCLSSLIGYLTLCFFESDSVMSVGYVDMINTIFFATVPLLICNIENGAIDEIVKQSQPYGKINR